MTLTRADDLIPALLPPDRAWTVTDANGVFVGFVAGSGRLWAAGRIGPLRTRPIVSIGMADTRTQAVALLVGS